MNKTRLKVFFSPAGIILNSWVLVIAGRQSRRYMLSRFAYITIYMWLFAICSAGLLPKHLYMAIWINVHYLVSCGNTSKRYWYIDSGEETNSNMLSRTNVHCRNTYKRCCDALGKITLIYWAGPTSTTLSSTWLLPMPSSALSPCLWKLSGDTWTRWDYNFKWI